MSDIAQTPLAPPLRAPERIHWMRAVWRRPALLLVVLSALFGPVLIMINPPLRGPDEPAHFARVYSYTQGILLPKTEVDGRKGVYLPASWYDDFAFFQSQIQKIWEPGFTFARVFEQYRSREAGRIGDDRHEPVFTPYEGSEAYTLAAYAPYVAVALIARAFDLDFVATLMLMRLAGLAAFTAIAAYAITLTPHLKWAFLLIAMLPASLYGRSVLGCDGATFSYTLLVIALSLRAAVRLRPDRPWKRALWMTLCVLSKPPQIIFVLLEPMIYRFKQLPAHWRSIALIVAPGVILSPLWIWAVGIELAVWRIVEDQYPPEVFRLGWKLNFMLEHPLHFPRVMFATLSGETFGLWRQLIGVLGWLDTHLSVAVYTLLSVLLLATMFERLALERAARLRLAAYAALIIAGYVIAVFLILFITWTPPTEAYVWGVQGRYFTGLLPLGAVLIAGLCNRSLPTRITAGAALLGSVVSGIACVEALWRVNWAG